MVHWLFRTAVLNTVYVMYISLGCEISVVFASLFISPRRTSFAIHVVYCIQLSLVGRNRVSAPTATVNVMPCYVITIAVGIVMLESSYICYVALQLASWKLCMKGVF